MASLATAAEIVDLCRVAQVPEIAPEAAIDEPLTTGQVADLVPASQIVLLVAGQEVFACAQAAEVGQVESVGQVPDTGAGAVDSRQVATAGSDTEGVIGCE